MSLNWNIEKIAEAAKSGKGWELTDQLIWATMGVGLGELTAKNEKEFRTRLAMWSITAPPSSPGAKSLFETLLAMTPEQWKERYGLSTNVPNETRASFRARVARYIEREAEARIKNEAAKAKAPANVLPFANGGGA